MSSKFIGTTSAKWKTFYTKGVAWVFDTYGTSSVVLEAEFEHLQCEAYISSDTSGDITGIFELLDVSGSAHSVENLTGYIQGSFEALTASGQVIGDNIRAEFQPLRAEGYMAADIVAQFEFLEASLWSLYGASITAEFSNFTVTAEGNSTVLRVECSFEELTATAHAGGSIEAELESLTATGKGYVSVSGAIKAAFEHASVEGFSGSQITGEFAALKCSAIGTINLIGNIRAQFSWLQAYGIGHLSVLADITATLLPLHGTGILTVSEDALGTVTAEFRSLYCSGSILSGQAGRITASTRSLQCTGTASSASYADIVAEFECLTAVLVSRDGASCTPYDTLEW